ncbi:MAG TPA: hypothetical protein VHV79_10250 [Mycobacteriales bacterium]|nr:hypothetical protein [Mycobacteriales bacterium]
MASSDQRVLQQSKGNLLGLPILIAVCVLAVVLREAFAKHPSWVTIGVCVAAAVLDVVLTLYLLRNLSATLVVTSEEITFARRKVGGFNKFTPQYIHRAPDSKLTFRSARNGPFGADFTGYTLVLRDDATGQEVGVGSFGRPAVQDACEAEGWSFG